MICFKFVTFSTNMSPLRIVSKISPQFSLQHSISILMKNSASSCDVLFSPNKINSCEIKKTTLKRMFGKNFYQLQFQPQKIYSHIKIQPCQKSNEILDKFYNYCNYEKTVMSHNCKWHFRALILWHIHHLR